MSSATDQLAHSLRAGKSRADLIGEMKDRGLTIIEAVKATRELFGVSLAEAKRLVCSHSAWTETAAAAAPLHEEAIRIFEDADRSEGQTD